MTELKSRKALFNPELKRRGIYVLPNLVTLRSPQQRNVVLHPSFVQGQYAFYTRPMDGFIDTGSGGGCNAAEGAGFAPLALLLALPLLTYARSGRNARK